MGRNVKVSAVLVVSMFSLVLLQADFVTAGTNKPVKVDANCPKKNDGKFTISVHPFLVEVARGDGVVWTLKTDNTDDQEIRITAKDPEAWIYTDTTVKGNKEVVMTEMVEGAPDGTYDYKITVYCGADSEPIVLDPRIKVGGGGG